MIVLQHTRVTAGISVVSGHLNGDGKAKAQSMRTPGKCEHFDGATGAPLANFRRSRSWAGRG